MTPATAAVFVVAAGAGGAGRHLVNRLGFGWRGTLAVNVVGSFLLGWLLAGEPSERLRTVVGTGGLGAFTTFSAFSLEAVEASPGSRAVIVTAGVAGGVVAAWCGHRLG